MTTNQTIQHYIDNGFEASRVHAAAQLFQDGLLTIDPKYATTETNCKCMDFAIRGRSHQIAACKHMIAKMMAEDLAWEVALAFSNVEVM